MFVGYSLEDPDFRQIWNVVSDRLGRTRRMAYSIAVGARPSEIARFERRGVKVINLPGNRDRYGDVLAGAFSELTEYVRSNVIAVSRVTEEKPLRELLLPRGATTRLCFFSLPLELLPFYREYVFPNVEDAGVVPVTSDDVVSPGDNISAKLKRAPFQLIVVVTDPEKAPPPAADFTVLVRPDILTVEPRDFILDLAEKLRHFAAMRGKDRQAEPQRLFDAGEYRAAVISAMTLLEARLRDHLNSPTSQKADRSLSMRPLVEMASDQGIFSASKRESVNSWMRLRNEVVHSATVVSRAKAREVVDGVITILETLEPLETPVFRG